jgi:putative NIF3 family GTP cyclohydrolase 1 type 2
MRADDIRDHFLSIADWVDPATTVDRIIVGDPGAEVSRVLVTWISSVGAIEQAVARGCQMVITHEPTFWVHANELAAVGGWTADSMKSLVADRKRRCIEEHGLVILRIHDAWDAWPEVGIPWAWARHLGLEGRPAALTERGYQQRYDIEPTSLDELARLIASRTAPLGEPAVQVAGPAGKLVSRVGVGAGCYCDVSTFQALGCDVSVVCDDGAWYWQDLQLAADNDHAIIRVNHGTSEEPGMITLTNYINDALPDVSAAHLPHGTCFRLVGRLPAR